MRFQYFGENCSLKLFVFSDSSMGNLADGGTQGGHFFMLIGEDGKFFTNMLAVKTHQESGSQERHWLQWLKRRLHTLPLPCIFLSNARSIANKMDELQLQIAANKIIRDCCILLIMETWLHSCIPDTAIEITGRTAHRYDRNSDSGREGRGFMHLCEQRLVHQSHYHR